MSAPCTALTGYLRSLSAWMTCVERGLQQFLDQRLSLFFADAELAARKRAIAIVQDGFEFVQRREVGAFPQKANRDFVAPLVAFIERSVKVRRVVALIFQNFDARIEPLISIVLVVSDAGAEDIDEREPFVLDS